MPNRTAKCRSKSIPEYMPDRMPQYMSNKMPHGRPNRMADGMSEWMPDYMSAGGDHSKKVLYVYIYRYIWYIWYIYITILLSSRKWSFFSAS